MVSNKLARRYRRLLEKVLATDEPDEKDVITLFGGLEGYSRFMEGRTQYNQMAKIANQLTPRDWIKSGARNYASDTMEWQKKVLPKLREGCPPDN
jgi:hypothetical protein|tara:strand:+ start:1669 stop:1953 length:285 start_codon:yes stop_codon:yes gene_type:complete